MPYQQVSQCKFYIDILSYMDALGLLPAQDHTFGHSGIGFNPYKIYSRTPAEMETGGTIVTFRNLEIPSSLTYNFVTILGHNYGGDSMQFFLGDADGETYQNLDSSLVNAGGGGVTWTPEYNGFTIGEFSSTYATIIKKIEIFRQSSPDPNKTYKTGSVALGQTYTLPHSPDLSLKLSYDYSGIKTIETKGGASLSNAFYTKPPMWGDTLGAWELDDGHGINQALSRSGRKIYDLSFSFLDDGDVFGSNQSLAKTTMATEIADGTPPASAFDSDDLADDNTFNDNVLTGDNFYSQVINKTQGLPFLFQPDKNDNTNMIIAKFDQKAFSFQQTSPGLYSIKCRIVETW